MKQIMNAVKNAAKAAWYKSNMAFMALVGLSFSGSVMAQAAGGGITGKDLTQDTSAGTKNFSTVAGNIDTAAQAGATLLIQLVSIGGFVVVAISLYQLWKASKDEREKPMSAIVGLFIGGAMAAVATIMWIMKNTIVG